MMYNTIEAHSIRGEHHLMKKRLIAILSSVGLSLALTCNVFAATTFSDIGDSYAKTEIEALAELGIIDGYTDKTFKPKQKITREEFAKLICKGLQLFENPQAAAKFTDVSEWARPYVGALVELGITNGTGKTTFGGKDPLTREQLATFFIRIMTWENTAKDLYTKGAIQCQFADNGQIDNYAKPNVALAQSIGFIKGVDANHFAPDDHADRQAVARLLYEYMTNNESIYVPRIIKLELPELLDVTHKYGPYTFIYEENNYINNKMRFTSEEIYNRSYLIYHTYHELISSGINKSVWNQLSNDEKRIIALHIYLSWQFLYSEVSLNVEYAILEETTQTDIENTVTMLVNGINKYFNTHSNGYLDEGACESIGINLEILFE